MKFLKFFTFTLSYLFLFTGLSFAGVSLKGVGSGLTASFYRKLLSEYQRLHPEVKVNYEVKNPYDAENQFLTRGAEFGTTDLPLTDSEEKKAFGRAVVHLPAAIDGVAITYNLPGVPSGIRLTPAVLSKIFRGEVKRWNDIAITEPNPGMAFPPMDILVLHREDESSLKDLFPVFLARLDPQWTAQQGQEKNLKWPVGRNVKGNDKVMEKLRQSPGVIAAVDFSYAARHQMPVVQLLNPAGHFVAPTVESLSAATGDWVNLPEDFKVVLGRSRAVGAYPLCSFSWILIYEDETKAVHDHKKAQAVADFVQWVFSDGQKYVKDSFLAPLPDSFLAQAREKIKEIKY